MKNIKHIYFSSSLFHIYFFLHHTISISAISTPAYTPIDNITLNCGSSADYEAGDGRIWSSDMGSKFGPSEQSNNRTSVMQAASYSSPSVEQVPYRTARISLSPFTYTFPVAETGPKFIRLYFYPASYPGFETSIAFFSVKAGRYTLLSNFTADSYGSKPFFKEFCINVIENQPLNITFAPSTTSSDADLYAFINGIEIVSMPTNLYYSPSGDVGIRFIGPQSPFDIDNNTALEMVYRLNVGGSFVSPKGDSGMYRTWYVDEEYMTEKGTTVIPVNTQIQPNYAKIPPYTAPNEVYITARSMGNNSTINQSYNLTWEFPVDSGFIYLVRLHFCELQENVTKENDRDFHIFIANQTAEERADLIVWSGGNGVPIYRDYAVLMQNEGRGQKQNISVALHPNPVIMTAYQDAILNGLELFKLSDSDGNLAGHSPDPPQTPPTAGLPGQQPAKPKNNRTTTIIVIAGGLLSGTVAFSLLCFLTFRRRYLRVRDSGAGDGASWWGSFPFSANKSKSSKTSGSHLPSDLCHHFSVAEIRKATNNFHGMGIIGAGGFGNVYKGYINIDGGATPVAIKRLNPGSQQGAHEFKTEIEMLSQLRYLHLVSLIGYCNDNNEMILVYDYMAQGTLRDHLYKTENPSLPWKKRLEICIGAARGLHYLHTGAKHVIIHRDVKTTNILLDEKWVAKVSDFGLSKVGPTSMSKAHVSTVVKGSLGYLDPEYFSRQQLTEKSDVYSFGVVLFEVLCARAPVNQSLPKEQVSLVEWARNCYYRGSIDQIVDSNLQGTIAAESLKKFVDTALNCLQDEGIERPTMSDVVWGLEFALQLQESSEKEILELGVSYKEINEDAEIALELSNADDVADYVFSSSSGHASNSNNSGITTTSTWGYTCASSDSDKALPGVVFSEIVDPKGR